jgi:UDP-glucose 4-epimerase
VKILVTGGSGFIGSHLVERLILDGHNVLVLDDFSTGNYENLNSQVEVIRGSVLDHQLVKKAVSRVEYVFHLAAAVGVFNIVEKPLQSMLINIRGTENVLAAANEFSIPIFITSSSEVYGKNESNTLRESDDRIVGSPAILRWSYSEAKAIDESLGIAYFAEHKLPVRIVRFFNTVGPRQLGRYGMVVPRFVEAALKNETIKIYGDGNQTRCFAHVYDAIDAVIAVAFSANTIGKIVNIGNNQEISINDLAKRVINVTESKSEVMHIGYDEAYGAGFEDMQRRIPSLDLIEELVGWKPRRDLDDIITDIKKEMTVKR